MKLIRKRLIPQECVVLEDDRIIYQDQDRIITQWKTLKPREDFSYGYSCYYLKEGYKISKFLKENGELKCWYCDMIAAKWNEAEESWIFTDLLADVIVKENKAVRVMDLDELAEAFENGMLTSGELTNVLYRLNRLLCKIENGEFETITAWIEQMIHQVLIQNSDK